MSNSEVGTAPRYLEQKQTAVNSGYTSNTNCKRIEIISLFYLVNMFRTNYTQRCTIVKLAVHPVI